MDDLFLSFLEGETQPNSACPPVQSVSVLSVLSSLFMEVPDQISAGLIKAALSVCARVYVRACVCVHAVSDCLHSFCAFD